MGTDPKGTVQVMREDIISAAELGANGIVAGVLTREGEVHVTQLSELLVLCRSLVSPCCCLATLSCQWPDAHRAPVLCIATGQRWPSRICLTTMSGGTALSSWHTLHDEQPAARCHEGSITAD